MALTVMAIGKLVKISDLFDIKYGNSLELIHLTQYNRKTGNSVPFVSRTEKNNGISAFVKVEPNIEPNPEHTLSVAVGGSVLSTFYQPIPFYTGFHVMVLIPKKSMSVIEMLFYATCISANKYKYNYGRQANKTLQYLLIPAQIPQKLNNHLISYHHKLSKSISTKSLIDEKIVLNPRAWKYFALKDLFEIGGTKTTPLLELEERGLGAHPYVTTQAANNGVEGFYDFYSESGGVLTVDSAVIGYCAYQVASFSASDHVEKLRPKFTMNAYIAMFLVTVLNMEQYRYNYGRKCSQERMKQMALKLPSKDRQPDWQYMEDYIKSLPYAANLQ